MKNKINLTLILSLLFSGLFAQERIVKVLVPKEKFSDRQNTFFIPDSGLSLYETPNGEFIGRITRISRKTQVIGATIEEQGISISHRNRRPSYLPKEALAPMENNCYAVPVVREKDGFVLLFDTVGPELLWVKLTELETANYTLQEWKAASEKKFYSEFGVGLLIPDSTAIKNLPKKNIAHVPAVNISLYDQPKGKKIAELSRFCPTGRFSDGLFRMFILPIENPNNCISITTKDLYASLDSVFYIQYTKQEGDFVQVFSKNGNYWIDLKELYTEKFEVKEYKDFFTSNKRYFIVTDNLKLNPLRESPYADAKIIEAPLYSQLLFDGSFCEGRFCKVALIPYKLDPCKVVPHVIPQAIEVWMLVIDEHGNPIIKINKGCDWY